MRNRYFGPRSVVVALSLIGVPLAAFADEAGEGSGFFAPKLEGEFVLEVQNDLTFESDDESAKINNLNSTSELDLNLYAAEPLFLNAHLTLEQTKDPAPDEDCEFCKHGVFVEALTLNWEDDRWFVYGGKFEPNFAIAWDAAPGIYGTNTSEDDIEMAERIGFGGGITVIEDERYGAHVLSASTFFTDTTELSESFGTNRGRTRLGDGGPSTTDSLESFVVALDGEEIPRLPGFRYHIGGGMQSVDRVVGEDGNELAPTAIDDEYRFAVGGEWAIEATESLTVTPLLEYVRLSNAGGTADEDRDYVTASTLLEYDSWNLALSYTGKFVDNPDGTDTDDYSAQVSAGYAFDFGLSADIGYKYDRAGGTDSHLFGILLAYELSFGY